MNYDQLVEQLVNFTENDSPRYLETIPSIVKMTEQFVYNTVQLPAIRKNVTGHVTTLDSYLTLPEDFLSAFSLAVVDLAGVYHYLLDKDVNYIRQSYPSNQISGLPKYYALFDAKSLLIGPTPDADYIMELHYFCYPPSIVTAGSTWLSENFSSVLLFGSLVNSAIYMKGETDVLEEYKASFNLGMALLKQLGDGKDRQDAYRSGQVRDKVQ